MKRILLLVAALGLVYSAYWLNLRISHNEVSLTPYPYIFTSKTYNDLSNNAPIVIIGDKLATRLATFKQRLSEKLSINLSKPIKIVDLTQEGQGVHRSLKKLKSLNKLPLIIIFMSNTDEQFEYLFHTQSLKNINHNFKLFSDDKIKTTLMIFPFLSKLIYEPISRVVLSELPKQDLNKYSDPEKQLRAAANFELYRAHLDELFSYTQKRNSLIIPITTPLNLKIPPTQSCYGSLVMEDKPQLKKLKQLIAKEDYKASYNEALELVMTNPSNAQILYLYAKSLRKLGKFAEAQKYGELAIAFDCGNTRGSPVYNSILRKISRTYGYNFFDFHQLLTDESQSNFVFIDDIYPQDYYLEKVVDTLAFKIKKRLKL
ncbi:MAG: tetratricopeptide repeat protein [Halobacteriovoraceae bacterium]|nr:tetratricopeptide repeat protein [Halobacteriovoraceae bacterium]